LYVQRDGSGNFAFGIWSVPIFWAVELIREREGSDK